MKTFATKQPSRNFVDRKAVRRNPIFTRRSLPPSLTMLQRKSGCPCGGVCPRCQSQARLRTKLKIGEPGDKYEKEADRVADEVMRMPESSVRHQIQPEENEENLRRKAIANSLTSGNRKQNEIDAPSIVNELLNSPSQHLEPRTRIFMESRLGYDFSKVRVHTDAKASESAKRINARAYTVGQDLVFGSGQYAPGTTAGRRLLAHELTHVVQQNGNTHTAILQRAETDTSQNCSSLTDSKSDVNDRFNQALKNARAKAGKLLTASKVIDEFFNELARDTSIGRSAVEDWAATLGSKKVDLPTQSATKFKGVNFGIWRQKSFPILNPTMKVNNICIGSDKLGHFVQQGFQYFEIVHRQGKTVTKAEEFGERTEGGGFGLETTGVFSNADLEANRKGLRFYEDLAANPALTFDITNYINNQWNEESNPSFYESSVAQRVWSNLLSRTWTGTFDIGGSKSATITVNLKATTAGNVTGTYQYTNNAGNRVNGTIQKGKIQFHTTTVRGQSTILGRKITQTPVNSITIDFEWSEGSSTGKGVWRSVGESALEGKWGSGSSKSNGGNWNLR